MTIIPALQGCDIPIPGTTWALAAGPDAIGVALGMRHAPVATDCETYGLGALAWSLKCVVFSDGHTCAVLDPRDPKQKMAIQRVLADAPKLLMWNASFDAPTLYQNGLLNYESIDKIVDGLLHARLANPDTFTPKSLEAVGDRCGVRAKGKPIAQTFKELGISKAQGFHTFDINVVSYLYGAALDGLVTYHVTPLVREDAKRTLMDNPYSSFRVQGAELDRLVDREQVVNRVLLRRACKGMRVDFEFAEDYRKQNQQAIDAASAQLKDIGVKPGDGQSLLKWMDGMGLISPDHPKTPTGKLQATAAVLEELAHPIAEIFVDCKRKTKLQDSYLDKMVEMSLPTGGRVHPRTNILAAVTGRTSVSDPPLQQIPNAARGIFMADEGDSLSSVDFSQIEPVTAAYMAGDHGVTRTWESDTGADLYQILADFSSARGTPISRKTAKVVLLAQLYGQGLAKLSKGLGLNPGALVETDNGWVHEYTEARELRDKIFEVMPATGDMISNIKSAAKRHRKVPSVSGRLIPIPVYRNKETGAEEVAAYAGVNYVAQSSCADLLYEAVYAIEAAGLADSIYLTVHDEILCSTSAAGDVQRIMETAPESFIRSAGSVPVIRTDREDMGERWLVQ